MAQEPMPATLRELLLQLDQQGIGDYRRYAAVRRYLGFKAREKNLPLIGSFELTPLCNFDCKMCYVHLQKDQMSGAPLLMAAQWKSIMQQAIDSGMLYASLTGGECLTYPAFRELYLFLRERGIEVTILSNGALMDAEMTAFLQKHPPAQIQISIYGASEEAYERVTGKRAFHTVWENISRMNAAGFPLKIAVTPSAFMQDGEKIIRMLHGKGLPYNINAGILQPRKETGRETADANLDAYVAMIQTIRNLNGKIIGDECDMETLPDTGQAEAAAENTKGVRCGGGRSSFAVDWKGGMRPCNNFPCESENVLSLGFAEAWKRINSLANHYQRPIECEGCAYSPVCKHCVAEHAAGAPVGHASPAVCAWAKTMIAKGLLDFRQPEQ